LLKWNIKTRSRPWRSIATFFAQSYTGKKMKIGIDISQISYEKTGVANYTRNLVQNLLTIDHKNEYILFFASLRKKYQISTLRLRSGQEFKIKTFKLPQTLLDILWNRLHICPIEWFVGNVDVFITSDWLEPPTIRAKKITIIHDLSTYKYPEETHQKTEFHIGPLTISPNIVAVQKRKLNWVKKESNLIICVSEATKKDAMKILGVEEKRLKVIYEGDIC